MLILDIHRTVVAVEGPKIITVTLFTRVKISTGGACTFLGPSGRFVWVVARDTDILVWGFQTDSRYLVVRLKKREEERDSVCVRECV